MKALLSGLFLVMVSVVYGQLTPPGLGSGSKLNSWFSIGLQQQLDSAGRLNSVTYAGADFQSTDNTMNPFERFGILVLNEELKYRLNKKWSSSLAVSYRHQNQYEKSEPFLQSEIPFKQEIRFYGKMTRTWKVKLNPSLSFRPEWRMFYKPDFGRWKEDLAFRFRIKAQFEIALNRSESLKFIPATEFLFSTERELSKTWSSFSYAETRLSAFVSYQPLSSKCIFSIGFMDDLLESTAGLDAVHYLSFSAVFKNIF